MNFSTINLKIIDSAAYVTINRPEVRNALNGTVVEELLTVITELNHNNDIRCIILSGEGKSFCSEPI